MKDREPMILWLNCNILSLAGAFSSNHSEVPVLVFDKSILDSAVSIPTPVRLETLNSIIKATCVSRVIRRSIQTPIIVIAWTKLGWLEPGLRPEASMTMGRLKRGSDDGSTPENVSLKLDCTTPRLALSDIV